MKKKTIYELDWDEGESLFDDVSLLLFHSIAPSYAFVDDLNKLYHLSFCRVNDMELQGMKWPLFICHDNMMKLNYYLVERPLNSELNSTIWTEGHKLLIVKGDRSETVVDEIHHEFCSSAINHDPADLLAMEHLELLNSLRSNFTTTTIINPSIPLGASSSKKMQRDYNNFCDLLSQILDYIDMEIICGN